ncbi:MAG: acyl carrier protein [Planctomycetota bacterium]
MGDRIREVVQNVFVEGFEIPPEELQPDARIFEDLGLDSLDVVDLIAAIQKEFGVRVRDDERIREVRTLQDLYDYMDTLRDELDMDFGDD